MKTFLKIIIPILLLFLVLFAFTSCNKDAEIETGNIKIENGAYTIYLSSSNTKIDISSYFSVPEGKKYEISKTENFEDIIEDVVELENGENKFYVRVVGSNKVYTFNFIKKKVFTVEYAYSNGEVFSTIQCEEGSILEAPKPTKQGYSIVWDYDFKKAIDSNVTITGNWVPNKYNVTISAEGSEMDGKVIEVVFGEKLIVETPSLKGYNFTGWTYNNAFFDLSSNYEIASDITLKANFEAIKYTINYHLNGGIKNENEWAVSFTVESDDIILTNPSWINDSYVFDGWYSDSEYKNHITKIVKGTTGSVDVYAKWINTQIKTEVTISAPGLSFDNEKITLIYGEAYDLSSYLKEGYSLLNWYYNDSILMNKGIWNSKVEELTISPVYEIINYKINYQLNGGVNNSINPKEYNVNDAVTLWDPSWNDDSYIFDGWYTDAEFNTPFDGIVVGSIGDISVYAKWIANIEAKDDITKITLSAPGYDNDGQAYEFKLGDEYTLPSLTQAGYNFIGWKTQDGTKNIPVTGTWAQEVEEIVIVPNFEIIEYKINYVLNGGDNVITNLNVYTILDEITFNDPTWNDSSYEFVGWYSDKDFTNHVTGIAAGTTEDITVYAKWTRYTVVTILANGFDCNQTTIKIEFGSDYVLPQIEKTGYNLNGWTDGTNTILSSGKWLIEASEVEITPVWNLRNYSISYVLNGGANTNVQDTFTIEDVIELLDATSEYAVFMGWYLDIECTQKIEKIENMSQDIVIYAAWKYEQYKVTFDSTGGDISSAEVTVNYGVVNNLPEPVKAGYSFAGWYNGNELIDTSKIWLIKEDITLTAKWNLVTYKIEYELNGGTPISGSLKTSYTIETPTMVLPILAKEGFKFLGWSLEEGPISRDVIISKGSYGDRKYIANWCDEIDSSGFMYNLYDDMTASVVGFNGVIGDATIPAEFNGYKVTSIATNAFNGLGKKLTSSSTNFVTFYIPETIVRIGANAFNDCDDLKVQLVGDKEEAEIQSWIENVTVESGNKHVEDVILGKRPAIGWKIYFKP